MDNLDVHSHIFPNELISKLGLHLNSAGQLYTLKVDGKVIGPLPKGFFNLESRISELQDCGIVRQIISPTHHLFMYMENAKVAQRFARNQNEAIAEICKKQSDKFVGNGTLPLQDVKFSLEELDHLYHTLELRGIEIGTNVAGRNLDDEALTPVYERLQELGIPILVHPNDILAPDRMKKYYLPIALGTLAETDLAVASVLFGGILERFPKLKFIFCHGGGTIPYQVGRIKRAADVREEITRKDAVQKHFSKLYFDTVLFDEGALKFFISRVGSERAVFGTDYPFNLGTWDAVSRMINLDLDNESKTKVMLSNATELYKLK